MSKVALREKYLKKRRGISESECDERSLKIANKTLELAIWEKDYFHIYLPILHKLEINTEYIISILSGKDKHIILSKSNFEDLSLTHILLTDSTTIKLNKYNIPEPEDGIEISPDKLEVVFVPLLAFDLNGNRVGYGKGFYDRFLSKCNPSIIKIGLSMFSAEKEIGDVSELDIKLDYCVTPERIYKFA